MVIENIVYVVRLGGDAISLTEKNNVILYSIVLSNDEKTKSNFKTLANFTGGMLLENGGKTIDIILNTLKNKFDDINLNSKILEKISENYTEKQIKEMTHINR